MVFGLHLIRQWCTEIGRYKGQLLTIVQEAVDHRTVDTTLLTRVTAAVIFLKLASRLLEHGKKRVSYPLSARLKQHYSLHLFYARARLDVPTFDDDAVQRQLEAASHINGQSIAWSTLMTVSGMASTAIKVTSQFSVLSSVLAAQRDGPLLAGLTALRSVYELFGWSRMNPLSASVWAATTTNADFVKLQGLKRVINDMEHRKEVVAGNISQYLYTLFQELTERVGYDAADFWDTYRERMQREKFSIISLLKEPLHELPQIAFALRAIQYPASIPISLTSLHLITETTSNFSWSLWRFLEQTGSIADQFATVRKLYDIVHIPNKIQDGTKPFPEDSQKVKHGISLEFRNVSFQYPGAHDYALRNISFKLEQGQLCVIVGTNGSGKSTILKLVARLYDPLEGEILVDGKDIRTVKLTDLRQAISVLFQDYTHFPLSIRDNIALGDPSHADDEDRIRLAARLGGSEGFIERLPEGLDTYLDRPVRDYYGGLPEGTKTLFGRPVDYSAVRFAAGTTSSRTMGLSGGQMQRLAVSRTFMRSVVSDDSPVGLLLFDEPSASLDPTAEHDLFARLRELRGNKTMVFSSHRFGNLTRHSDLILYMNDSQILETGTHEELLKREGDYARIWMLQAQAFL